MAVSVTIRDVPQEVRDELAARAAREGQSLQGYLRTTLIDLASRPTMDVFLAEVRNRVAMTGVELSVDNVIAARDADRG